MTHRTHTFHIPVMGTSYTIDTPIRVAHYGIDSVVSIIDHRLIENMREHYSKLYALPFEAIGEKEEDSRARRIMAYLDLMQEIVQEKFQKLKNSLFEEGSEITKYFQMLPSSSPLRQEYETMLAKKDGKAQMQEVLRGQIRPGSIDVNIMTKIDGAHHGSKKTLPVEFNDAHAALRGFAGSKLASSVVFSAGMNPRLFGYAATFRDFLPDENGKLKKKIILKVSDYRSAEIQGKFLAKKGLWVSEFRIESGLNCGGHAFATDGYLLGPIMQEFREKKEELIGTLFKIFSQAVENIPASAPPVAISVQGGVGNACEHDFLLKNYGMDSIGWGSPFLLVPEAVNIDQDTLDLLAGAEEKDLYLSDVSPLGVPFNTVKGSTAEKEKQDRIKAGKPGAPCFKKHLSFNTEFTDKPICTASRQYQRTKIKELKETLTDPTALQMAIDKVTEKMCLCVGLGNAAAINNDLEMYKGMPGVTVCPGPNMAYFSEILSLHKMTDHIYGRTNVVKVAHRPHMFIKELGMYIGHLKERFAACSESISEKQRSYLVQFQENLLEGVEHYKNLLSQFPEMLEEAGNRFVADLMRLQGEIMEIALP